jgi:U3 small nucleolar RNA-associated protein 23
LPGGECIKRQVGERNYKKLFVATQDLALRIELRKVPSVPLVYFAHNIMTLDEPTDLTLKKSERVNCRQKEEIRLQPEDTERKSLKRLLSQVKEERKEAEREALEELQKDKDYVKLKTLFKSRKHAKGPNPLSVKRKAQGEEAGRGEGKKTRRKRRKVAEVDP